MTNKKIQFKTSNSAAIPAGSLQYPLSEIGGPSDIDRLEAFPLRSFVIENKSSQSITVILDIKGNSSDKEFAVPNGKTLALENRDNVTYYQIAIKNDGTLEIAIDEIVTTVRNY